MRKFIVFFALIFILAGLFDVVEAKAKGGGPSAPTDTLPTEGGETEQRDRITEINGSYKDVMTRLIMIQGVPFLILMGCVYFQCFVMNKPSASSED